MRRIHTYNNIYILTCEWVQVLLYMCILYYIRLYIYILNTFIYIIYYIPIILYTPRRSCASFTLDSPTAIIFLAHRKLFFNVYSYIILYIYINILLLSQRQRMKCIKSDLRRRMSSSSSAQQRRKQLHLYIIYAREI